MAGDPRPIGVFDSGMGGLTVLRALHERLPRELRTAIPQRGEARPVVRVARRQPLELRRVVEHVDHPQVASPRPRARRREHVHEELVDHPCPRRLLRRLRRCCSRSPRHRRRR